MVEASFGSVIPTTIARPVLIGWRSVLMGKPSVLAFPIMPFSPNKRRQLYGIGLWLILLGYDILLGGEWWILWFGDALGAGLEWGAVPFFDGLSCGLPSILAFFHRPWKPWKRPSIRLSFLACYWGASHGKECSIVALCFSYIWRPAFLKNYFDPITCLGWHHNKLQFNKTYSKYNGEMQRRSCRLHRRWGPWSVCGAERCICSILSSTRHQTMCSVGSILSILGTDLNPRPPGSCIPSQRNRWRTYV